MDAAGNYIAGEWIGSSEAAEDINPSNTGDVVGLFARADAKATERAIAAAKAAFPAWSRGSIQQRHDILKKIGEEATETVMAAKDGEAKKIVSETADLWFHCLVMLAHHGLRPSDVLQELHRREGISGLDEKAARGKAGDTGPGRGTR